MQNTSLTEQFAHTIDNLLRGVDVASANRFIISFVETKECWIPALQLLESDILHIQYFCGNILYTKIRKDWNQLNEEERKEVMERLSSITLSKGPKLKADGDSMKILDRLSLAWCAACIRYPKGLELLLSTIFQLLQSSIQEIKQQQNLNNIDNITFSLEILSILPNEISSSDISHKIKQEMDLTLQNAINEFLDMLTVLSEFALNNQLLFVSILKIFQTWQGKGLSLSKLYQHHQSLYQMICFGFQLQSSAMFDIFSICCNIIQESFSISEYPKSQYQDQILLNFIEILCQSSENILMMETSYDEVGNSIKNMVLNQFVLTLTTIAINEKRLFSFSTEDDESLKNPEINQKYQELSVFFFNSLLSCIQRKPRSLAFLTFDLWDTVQDFPKDQIYPNFDEIVIPTLLMTLINHSIHPLNILDEFDEDYEDLLSFRDIRLGVQDVLLFCINSGPNHFFSSIEKCRQQAMQTQLNGLNSWEVLFFTLQAAMECIKDIIMEDEHNSIDKAAIIRFLCELAKQGLTLHHQYQIPILLQQSICRYLGSLTYLLTTENLVILQLEPDLKTIYYMALSYTLQSMTKNSLTEVKKPENENKKSGKKEEISDELTNLLKTAVKSFQQLCVRGSHILTGTSKNITLEQSEEGLNTFKSLIEVAGVFLQNIYNIPEFALLTVIESLTRNIMLIKDNKKQELLKTLTTPIVENIGSELQHERFDTRKIVLLLLAAGQIIRFSDTGSSNSTHILLPFMQVFWPQLEYLCSKSETLQHEGIMIRATIFKVYGHVFLSIGDLAVLEAPRVTTFIIGQLQETISSYNSLGSSNFITNIDSSAATSALGCAKSFIESFSHLTNNVDSNSSSNKIMIGNLIRDLFQQVNTSFSLVLRSNNPSALVFIRDSEFIEAYFQFVRTGLLFWRNEIISATSGLQTVLELSLLSLSKSREKDPLRASSQVIQTLFFPNTKSTSSVPVDLEFAIVCLISQQYGNRLAALLLSAICSNELPTGLLPSLTETLQCIISGCCSRDFSGARNVTREQTYELLSSCKGWFEYGFLSFEMGGNGEKMFNLVLPLTVTEDHRKLLIKLIIDFGCHQSRRFKSLILDLHKISNSEMPPDTLLSYI